MRAIEKLAAYENNEKAKQRFLTGLTDTDELVRLECLEALSTQDVTNSLCDIRRCLSDESWLVRGNTAFFLSETNYTQAKNDIRSNLDNCENIEEKVRYFAALYNLGDVSNYQKVLDVLDDEFYRARIAAVRLLLNISSEVESSKLIGKFEEILESEDSVAVQSCLKEAIEELK